MTAITRVYGDGLRFVAVATALSAEVAASDLSVEDFAVVGRTVAAVCPATSADPADRSDKGTFAIVELSDPDAAAILSVTPERTSPPAGTPQGGKPGWKAGDRTITDTTWVTPHATLAIAEITSADGNTLAATTLDTCAVRNLIPDDFEQRVWNHP